MLTPKTICNRIMNFVIGLILITPAVAFLDYIVRKGPNKPRPRSITLWFADAVKLFTKKLNVPFLSYYLFLPITIIILTLMLLEAISHSFHPMSIVVAITIMRIGVYRTLWPGWRNKNYSLLEVVHDKSQTISYEVSITIPFFILFRIFEVIFCYFAIFINLYFFAIFFFRSKRPLPLWLILLVIIIDVYFLGFIDCRSYYTNFLNLFKK